MAIDKEMDKKQPAPANGTPHADGRKGPRGPRTPKTLTFADHLAATVKAFESMSDIDRRRLIDTLRAVYAV